MKFLSRKALVVIVPFMMAVLCSQTQAQSCAARESGVKWTSPDALFTVEVPKSLKREDSSYPKEIKVYGAIVGECVFVIYVIPLPPEELKKKEIFSEKIDGLQFMLGGDDDHDFSEEMLEIQKFKAKKIVYDKQNTQGLFIDAGPYIFVLGFTSKNRENLSSPEAKRFFELFRISAHKIPR